MFHPLADLARKAIRHYLETGEYLDVSGLAGDGPPQGLFVSLHDQPQPDEMEGRLRGCRGSVRPLGPTLYAEVVRQAVYAAIDDPRCESVELDEVETVEVTVYLLGPHEEIEHLDQLDPARYGIIVEAGGGRRALLLPGISGIDTAEEQVYLTKRKAWIDPEEPARIYRFEAEVLK